VKRTGSSPSKRATQSSKLARGVMWWGDDFGIVKWMWWTVASRACSRGQTTKMEYIGGRTRDQLRGLGERERGAIVVESDAIEPGVAVCSGEWMPRGWEGSSRLMGGRISERIASDPVEDTEEKSVELVREVRIDGSELPDDPADD